jgi:hypothetical protein
MKHTPGPWSQKGYRKLDITRPDGKVVASAIASSEHPASELQANANARLIAAAPELAEALQALYYTCVSDGRPMNGAMIQARDTLLKIAE